MTEGEPSNPEEPGSVGVCLNPSSDGSSWKALLMEEVSCAKGPGSWQPVGY